jgi:putative transposase
MSFRLLYAFVVIEVGSHRMAHFNVTAHPTADWTLQQFREVITGEQSQRFLIHDRDGIYSADLDSGLRSMGWAMLKTPVRAPQAPAFCEPRIGKIRRECLDLLIPINDRHLRGILNEGVAHYKPGRPHSSLGPGIPEPDPAASTPKFCGHRIPEGHRVTARPISGGLHHESSLKTIAA